jgi:Reductase C-terminal
MLGKRIAYDEIHWFWSDQYDANLQYAGFHTKWEQVVVRGRLESDSYLRSNAASRDARPGKWRRISDSGHYGRPNFLRSATTRGSPRTAASSGAISTRPNRCGAVVATRSNAANVRSLSSMTA